MPVNAAALRILTYPDPALLTQADPVERIDDDVRAVAARMVELMREADGIGLAATQVGLPWRLFVAHVPESDDRPLGADPLLATPAPRTYINPELSDPQGAPVAQSEGCLSLPDISGEVIRSPRITVTALDERGNRFTQRLDGLLARCIQHETDHLDGILIIHRMTQLSRMKNKAALRELSGRAPRG